MFRGRGAERGVSPVIGGVLLVAIVLILASIAAAFVFQLDREQPPAPEASLELEPIEGSNNYDSVHTGGDDINGNRVTLKGVANPAVLHDTTLTAGDSVTILPVDGKLTMVWESGPKSDVTYSIFEAPLDRRSGGASGGDCVVRRNGNEYESICIEEQNDTDYYYNFTYNYTVRDGAYDYVYNYTYVYDASTGDDGDSYEFSDENGDCEPDPNPDPEPEPEPEPPGDSDPDPDPDPDGSPC